MGLVASVVLAAEELGVTSRVEVAPPKPRSNQIQWRAYERIGVSHVGSGFDLSKITV